MRASLVAQKVKHLSAMWETRVQSLGREDPPGGGNGNPLQYSCRENSMDGAAWEATVHGVATSWTRLSDFTSFCFAFWNRALQGQTTTVFQPHSNFITLGTLIFKSACSLSFLVTPKSILAVPSQSADMPRAVKTQLSQCPCS